MDVFEFKNGSIIQTVNTSNCNIRGKRAELIGFYCRWCNCVHIDYPMKDTIMVDNDICCNKILTEK